MIKVNILYPNKAGSRFDLEYYFNTHMPMSIEKLGTALRGVSALKSAPTMFCDGKVGGNVVCAEEALNLASSKSS